MSAGAGHPERPWPPHTEAEYREEAQRRLGPELAARFGQVGLLVLDADGIMTSGELLYGPQGEALKAFHARDGLGLVMARTGGVQRAVLTGRNSAIVERRATELRFEAIRLGRFDKQAALQEILEQTGCAAEHALYMGDDLIDVPALRMAGLAVTVPGAPAEVQAEADYVTEAEGGAGAIREITDLLLKASGRYGLALGRLADKAWIPTRQELSSDVDGGPHGDPSRGAGKDEDR